MIRQIFIIATALFLSPFVRGEITAIESDPLLSRHMIGSDTFQVQIEPQPSDTMAKAGPRFDTTSVVTQVTLDGRSMLALRGLCDEFNILAPYDPPGFTEAAVGDPFLKIGVGVLRRYNEIHYQFWQPYPVIELAKNTFIGNASEPAYEQTARLKEDYAYRYRKRYKVNSTRRILTIYYEMTNTGRKELRFEHYNHNYFAFGELPIDGNYRVETGFTTPDKLPNWLSRQGNQLMLARVMHQGQAYFMRTPAEKDQNHFRIFHCVNGAGVKVSGDFRLARFTLYADLFTMSPEVFMQMTLKPGESIAWSRTYEFFNGIDTPATQRADSNPAR